MPDFALASPNAAPAAPSPRRTAMIALVAGLCVAVFLVLSSPFVAFWPLIPLGFFALYVAYRQLFPCVLVYCFIIPLETLQAGGAFGLSKALGGLLILVCLLRLLVRRERTDMARLPVLKPLLLWLAFVGLCLFTTLSFRLSLAGIKLLLPPLGIFFFCLFSINTRRRFILAVQSYALGAATCALLALPFARRDKDGRLIGFGDDPNFFAAFFVAGFALCVALALRSRGGMRLFWALCAFSQAGIVLQSQSRAGVAVIALLALALLGPLIRKIHVRNVAVLILAFCIGAGAVAAASPEKLVGRFTSIVSGTGGVRDLSTHRRLSYVPVALKNLAEHPLLGSGINTYPVVYARSPYAVMWTNNDVYRYAHNTFLEMYSDLGLAGGTAFMAIFLHCLLLLRNTHGRLRDSGLTDDALLVNGVFFAIAGLMLMLLTISASFSKPLWMFTALASGVQMSFSSALDNEEIL